MEIKTTQSKIDACCLTGASASDNHLRPLRYGSLRRRVVGLGALATIVTESLPWAEVRSTSGGDGRSLHEQVRISGVYFRFF